MSNFLAYGEEIIRTIPGVTKGGNVGAVLLTTYRLAWQSDTDATQVCEIVD